VRNRSASIFRANAWLRSVHLPVDVRGVDTAVRKGVDVGSPRGRRDFAAVLDELGERPVGVVAVHRVDERVDPLWVGRPDAGRDVLPVVDDLGCAEPTDPGLVRGKGSRDDRRTPAGGQLHGIRVAAEADAEEEPEAEQEHDRPGGAKDARHTRPAGAVGAREQPAHVGLVDRSRVESSTDIAEEVVILHTGYI
jgi:hypothetical protein